ncbi:MAG: tetratricopeptide repeat protein, partial [Candidatus Marinimicrobia bacterium]|nr:tetratricopeptide repeat protein [Candidatus Neomarinimicrobiota bacterium]
YVNPSHMLLMGSNQEFSISYERLIERLSIPAVNADLAETNYDNVLEILTNFVAAGDELKKYSEKAPFNSDDFPVVEFSRVMSVAVNTDVTESLLRIKQPILPYLTNIPDSISSHLESDLGRYNQMKDYVIQGQVYAWTGKYDKAESYYQKALRLIPSANAEYLLDKVLNIGDELKALIKFNPRNEKVLKALGENYLKNKKLREAKNQLRRALEIKNDYHEARHLLGIVYFYENVIQTALNEFQTVISKRPDYGPSYFYTGLCYWKMGNLPGATNAFKTALDLDPGEGNNYLWYGKALEMAGKKNEALDIYYRLLDIEPANLEALQASDRLKKSMTFNR